MKDTMQQKLMQLFTFRIVSPTVPLKLITFFCPFHTLISISLLIRSFPYSFAFTLSHV